MLVNIIKCASRFAFRIEIYIGIGILYHKRLFYDEMCYHPPDCEITQNIRTNPCDALPYTLQNAVHVVVLLRRRQERERNVHAPLAQQALLLPEGR